MVKEKDLQTLVYLTDSNNKNTIEKKPALIAGFFVYIKV